jgi:hypothetical protein
MCGGTDASLISCCRDEDRVTLDLGFSNPLMFPPSRYRGIVGFASAEARIGRYSGAALPNGYRGLAREQLNGRL